MRPSKEEPKEEVMLAGPLGPKWSLRCSKECPERCEVAQDASAAASSAPGSRDTKRCDTGSRGGRVVCESGAGGSWTRSAVLDVVTDDDNGK